MTSLSLQALCLALSTGLLGCVNSVAWTIRSIELRAVLATVDEIVIGEWFLG